MNITWKKTGNDLHGTEVEVFDGDVSLGKIWAGAESTDEEIDARVASWVEARG